MQAKRPAAHVRSRVFQGEDRGYLWFLAPVLTVMAVITLYPLLYGLVMSFTDLHLTRPRTGVFIGLGNYIQMLQSAHFRATVFNALLLILWAVSAQMALGFLLALILNRGLPGFGLARTFLMLPMTVPTVVSSLAWSSMLHADYGVINWALRWVGFANPPAWLSDPRFAMLSIVLVDVWQWVPFVMLILLSGLYTMPDAHVEAALVDGASPLQVLRYVIVPYLRPLFGVVLLFRTIDAFKLFDKIYILTGGGPGTVTETVNFYAYRQGFAFFNMGYASAVSVFILGIVFLLSVTIIRSTQRLEDA